MNTTYPRFQIKFTFKGKPINSLSTKKSLRIMHRIRLSQTEFKWDRAYLKVRYNQDCINEGYYQNTKDLKLAYKCFLEIISEFTKEK